MTLDPCPTCGGPRYPWALHRCRLWADSAVECSECKEQHWPEALHDGLCAKCWAQRTFEALQDALDE